MVTLSVVLLCPDSKVYHLDTKTICSLAKTTTDNKMAKGGSLKAALVAQQAGAARKAAQVKAQEAKERKEKSMAGGGLTKKQKAQRALKARYEQGDAKVPGSHKNIDRAKNNIVKARNLTYPFDKTDTILLVGEETFPIPFLSSLRLTVIRLREFWLRPTTMKRCAIANIQMLKK